MVEHPTVDRLAEIVVVRDGRPVERGTGYVVAPGWILTAYHVVEDATEIGIWLGAPERLDQSDGFRIPMDQIVAAPGARIALLPVDTTENASANTYAPLGRLDRRSAAPVPVVAAGFPLSKVRPSHQQPDISLRDLHYAFGTISAAANVKTRTYELALQVQPADDLKATQSPWSGMSGSAVWAEGRLIGVVGEHHPGEGPGVLTVYPLENLFDEISERLARWTAALPQLAASRDELLAVAPPVARHIDVLRAQRAVDALAPLVLIGRATELDDLRAFTTSNNRWRWIKGEPFAGKTALLAWFVKHRPAHVDAVACFLRRTTGENTAEYALDVLSRQLAVVAGRHGFRPAQFPSERAHDFLDLLDEASRMSREQARALLVVIDGLDEYEPSNTSLELDNWLPGAKELPPGAQLVVSSRTGADDPLAARHPLNGHVHHLATSEAAIEIEQAARAELTRALASPGDFTFPLVACLAAARGGLTAKELAILLNRRGRHADVAEIENVLHGSLRRSLMYVADVDLPDTWVYVFAHDSLLAQARTRCADDIPAYERHFDDWANDYAARGWPVETPRYLMRPYSRMLGARVGEATTSGQTAAATDQLFTVVAHPGRSARLFARTGNPAVVDQEVIATQQVIATAKRNDAPTPDSLFRLAVLALRRQPVPAAFSDIAATIAATWASIGRSDAAIGLATSIDEPEARGKALHRVATLLAKAGLAEPSLQAAAGISAADRRTLALGQVAEALAGTGHADSARHALAGLDAAENRSQIAQRVAIALARSGHADAALKVAVEVKEQWLRNAALVEVAASAAAAGQTSTARAALTNLTDPQRRNLGLSTMATAFAAGGFVETALATATEIDDEDQRTDTLRQVAQAFAGIGDIQPTMRALAAVSGSNRQAEIFIDVAESLAKAGRHESATAVTGAALDVSDLSPWRRAQIYSRAAYVYTAAGDRKLARSAANAAHDAATEVNDSSHQATVLGDVAHRLAEVGQSEVAIATARRIVNIARQSATLADIARILCRSGDSVAAGRAAAAAVELLPHQDGDHLPESTSVELVRNLLLAGQPQLAERAIGTIAVGRIRAMLFAEIAQALAAAGDWSEAVRVATLVATEDPHVGSPSALRSAAKALVGAGRQAEAAALADVAIAAAGFVGRAPQRMEILYAAMAIFAWAGCTDRAIKAVRTLRNPDEREALLRRLAMELAENGAPDEVLVAARDLYDRERALAEAAGILADAGEVDAALGILAGVEEIEKRAMALAEVANRLAAAGLTDSAAAVASQALQTLSGAPLWQKATEPAEIALVLARAGYAEAAMMAAEKIQRRAQRAKSLVEVATALTARGDPEGAVSAAEKAAAAIEDAARGERDRVLTIVVRTIAAAGRPDRARRLASGIADARTRVGLIRSIESAPSNLRGAAKDDETTPAVDRGAATQDRYDAAVESTQVMRHLLAQGLTTDARLVAEQAFANVPQIKSTGDRYDVLERIGRATAEFGLVDLALRAASELGVEERRLRLLNQIAHRLADRGFLDEAGEAASALAGSALSVDAWSNIAIAMRASARDDGADRADRAAELALEAAAKSTPAIKSAEASARLATFFVRAGHIDAALTASEQAMQTELQGNEVGPLVRLLGEAAGALAAAGQPDAARRLLTRGLDLSQRLPSISRRVKTLVDVADELSKTGDPELVPLALTKALEASRRLGKPAEASDALRAIARIAIDRHQLDTASIAIDRALELARGIRDVHQRVQTLTALAQTLSEAGQAERALAVAWRAHHQARRLVHGLERAHALNAVALVFAHAGVAEAAVGAAADIHIESRQLSTLSQIADILAAGGQIQPAMRVLSNIDESSQRADGVAGVAQSLARNGFAEPAFQVASTIDDPRRRAEALGNAVAALLKSGREELMLEAAQEALNAAAQIVDQSQRAEVLAALISDPALRAAQSDPLYYSAMELLLLTPSASKYLRFLPADLLLRLVTEHWL